MPKKSPSTIPADYLEKVIRELESCPFAVGSRRRREGDAPPTAPSPAPQPEAAATPSDAPVAPKGKPRITFSLPAELHESAKNAVFHLKSLPGRWSLSELARRGLERELKRLAKRHNDGKPFPPPEEG